MLCKCYIYNQINGDGYNDIVFPDNYGQMVIGLRGHEAPFAHVNMSLIIQDPYMSVSVTGMNVYLAGSVRVIDVNRK